MSQGTALDSTSAHLRKVLGAEQVSARMPSLVAGLVRDGELIWWQGRGQAVLRGAEDEPGPDTQYRIGSITKSMTAVLVMQLRDEGKLDLADRLDRHLPDTAFGDATVRQLLSHAAGMPAEPPAPWWERSPGKSYPELIGALDGTSRPLPAAQQYHYSNLAFALLGEVVARCHLCSWWEALQGQLLQPLGLLRTTYQPEAPAAQGFSVDAFAGTLTDEPAQDAGAMAAAGQLWSTVADLARYAAFLTDPKADVLSPDTMREMVTVQSGTPEDGLAAGYGLGLRLLNAGGRTLVGHTGSMPGFLAGLFVDRERRTGAVCLANGTAGLRCEGLPVDLLTLLEVHEPTVPVAWAPTRGLPGGVADLLGLWHWGETALLVGYAAGELTMTRPGDDCPAHRYRPAGLDTFVGVSGYHTGETLMVVRDADGSVRYLECTTYIYTRQPYDPSAPIPGGAPRRLSWPG